MPCPFFNIKLVYVDLNTLNTSHLATSLMIVEVKDMEVVVHKILEGMANERLMLMLKYSYLCISCIPYKDIRVFYLD